MSCASLRRPGAMLLLLVAFAALATTRTNGAALRSDPYGDKKSSKPVWDSDEQDSSLLHEQAPQTVSKYGLLKQVVYPPKPVNKVQALQDQFTQLEAQADKNDEEIKKLLGEVQGLVELRHPKIDEAVPADYLEDITHEETVAAAAPLPDESSEEQHPDDGAMQNDAPQVAAEIISTTDRTHNTNVKATTETARQDDISTTQRPADSSEQHGDNDTSSYEENHAAVAHEGVKATTETARQDDVAAEVTTTIAGAEDNSVKATTETARQDHFSTTQRPADSSEQHGDNDTSSSEENHAEVAQEGAKVQMTTESARQDEAAAEVTTTGSEHNGSKATMETARQDHFSTTQRPGDYSEQHGDNYTSSSEENHAEVAQEGAKATTETARQDAGEDATTASSVAHVTDADSAEHHPHGHGDQDSSEEDPIQVTQNGQHTVVESARGDENNVAASTTSTPSAVHDEIDSNEEHHNQVGGGHHDADSSEEQSDHTTETSRSDNNADDVVTTDNVTDAFSSESHFANGKHDQEYSEKDHSTVATLMVTESARGDDAVTTTDASSTFESTAATTAESARGDEASTDAAELTTTTTTEQARADEQDLSATTTISSSADVVTVDDSKTEVAREDADAFTTTESNSADQAVSTTEVAAARADDQTDASSDGEVSTTTHAPTNQQTTESAAARADDVATTKTTAGDGGMTTTVGQASDEHGNADNDAEEVVTVYLTVEKQDAATPVTTESPANETARQDDSSTSKPIETSTFSEDYQTEVSTKVSEQ